MRQVKMIATLCALFLALPAWAQRVGDINARKVNGVIYVNTYASSGSGTAASPWTGYEGWTSDISAASGGIVIYPPGFYSQTAAVDLPTNLLNTLNVSGYGAEVKLNAASPRLFDIAKTADYDTVRNIVIEGFRINGNDLTGKNNVIFGNDEGGSLTARLQYDNLTFRDLYAYNVKTDSDTGTNHNGFIRLDLINSGSETQVLDATNILIENVTMIGGNWGILLTTTNTNPSNSNYENITIRDSVHDMSSDGTDIQSTSFGSTCFHVGSYGVGDNIVFDSLSCYAPGDNCYEINGIENASIVNSWCHNPIAGSVTLLNYTEPTNVEGQVNNVIGGGVVIDTSVPGSSEVKGVSVSCSSTDFGAAYISNYAYIAEGAQTNDDGMGPFVDVTCGGQAVRGVTIRDMSAFVDDLARDATDNVTQYMVRLDGDEKDWDGDGTVEMPKWTIDGLHIDMDWDESAAGTTNLFGIGINGDARVNFNDISISHRTNSDNLFYGIYFGGGTGQTVFGTISGVDLSVTGASLSTLALLRVDSTATVTVSPSLGLLELSGSGTSGAASVSVESSNLASVYTTLESANVRLGHNSDEDITITFDQSGGTDPTLGYDLSDDEFELLGDGDGDGTLVGLRVQGLVSCDTIDTTAAGVLQCGTDASGGAGVLDLGNDDTLESSALGEIATVNDTNSIFTEPTDDKLLIDAAQNWPTSDDTDAVDGLTLIGEKFLNYTIKATDDAADGTADEARWWPNVWDPGGQTDDRLAYVNINAGANNRVEMASSGITISGVSYNALSGISTITTTSTITGGSTVMAPNVSITSIASGQCVEGISLTPTTGTVRCQDDATATEDGYLLTTDWTSFDNRMNYVGLTFPGGAGGMDNVIARYHDADNDGTYDKRTEGIQGYSSSPPTFDDSGVPSFPGIQGCNADNKKLETADTTGLFSCGDALVPLGASGDLLVSDGASGYLEEIDVFVTDPDLDGTYDTITAAKFIAQDPGDNSRRQVLLANSGHADKDGDDTAEAEAILYANSSDGTLAELFFKDESDADGTGVGHMILTTGNEAGVISVAFDGTDNATYGIVDDTVVEADLDVAGTDAPADGECLTWSSGDSAFLWATCGAGSGDITDVWTAASGNVNALTAASGDSMDAGSADTFEIKNGTSVTPSAVGEFHMDTDGDGTVVGALIQLFGDMDGNGTSADAVGYLYPVGGQPTDNQIMKFDATTKKVQWEADAGTGSKPDFDVWIPANEFEMLDDGAPEPAFLADVTGTNAFLSVVLFESDADDDGSDGSANDESCAQTSFRIPGDPNTSGTVKFEVNWIEDGDDDGTDCGETGDVNWEIRYLSLANDDAWDAAFTTKDGGASGRASNGLTDILKLSIEETFSSLTGWAADETVLLKVCRDPDDGADDCAAGEGVGLVGLFIEIPRS